MSLRNHPQMGLMTSSIIDACLLCIFLFLFSTHVQGKQYGFMKDALHGGARGHYDYIVVGGGTSGCPLAATLSKGFKVLLLERGGSPYENPNVTRSENFHINLMDISEESASQVFVSEDGVVNSRARVLGGGSAINAGFYSRASPEYVRSAGWDGQLVNESFPWVEKMVAHRPAMKAWQSTVKQALLEVGIAPYNGFTYDHVYGTKEGGTLFDKTGYRHTAADLLSYADPTNLTVLLHATAVRLVIDKPAKGKMLIKGVIYRDRNGKLHEALLNDCNSGEVIVSAGALGSPQLLMLSGIGPENHLKSMGIKVELHNPHVGQFMADNPMNSIVIPTDRPLQKSLLQVVGITKFGSFIEASSGFGTMPNSIHRALSYQFYKRKGKEEVIVRPCVEELFSGGFIVEKIKGPLSKGHLRLKSKNVEDTPLVTFNYFKNRHDLRRCVKAIKHMERMIESRSFKRFLRATSKRVPSIEEMKNMSAALATNLLPKHANLTTSREQFCKDTVTTIWHYHGGCVVDKVVNKNFRVKGTMNLRVVDGSTFKSSPGTNPQATVMMLGRYAGVNILTQRLGPNAPI